MGLENRDYYRDGSYTDSVAGWGVSFTPVVKYLILANAIVFLLQIFLVRKMSPEEIDQQINEQMAQYEKMLKATQYAPPDPNEDEDEDAQEKSDAAREKALRQYRQHMASALAETSRISAVQKWCELDPKKTVYQGQIWRLLTCAFCHDRVQIWHIVFNMVLLYWFGTRLESMYGSREFLLFYLAAAVSGSIAYVALALYTGSNVPAIGASGAVMGVMMLYAIYYPFETVMIFWLIPVPIWILLSLYVLYDLHPVLLALAGDKLYSQIAHAGHLGGLAFGFLYWKTGVRLEAPLDRTPRLLRGPRPQAKPKPVPAPQPDALTDQVDAILQKITEQGQASLTAEEKAILHNASARYRRKS
jgi:membrane associated rhomboid family serine protease